MSLNKPIIKFRSGATTISYDLRKMTNAEIVNLRNDLMHKRDAIAVDIKNELEKPVRNLSWLSRAKEAASIQESYIQFIDQFLIEGSKPRRAMNFFESFFATARKELDLDVFERIEVKAREAVRS